MTRVACLTPTGSGAIAVIAVEGERAWEVARTVFRPAKKPLPERPEVGRTWFGRVGDGAGDEVILAVVSHEQIEIHCHGGRRVVEWLIATLRRHGCEPCHWGDIVRDEAIRQLARARTTRTAAILLDQLHGAFDRAWNAGEIAELARWTHVGRHLVEPWRVVIAGPPNVGKSSLINALSGYERCIVAPLPGTTRDVVSTTLAFDGWLVELSDTAGLRSTAEPIEREGIARGRVAITSADLIVWVLDATAAPVWPDSELPADRTLVVRNKVDLNGSSADDILSVSAVTRVGIDALIAAVVRRLVPVEPPPGTAVPFSAEWCDRVEDSARRG